MLYLDQGAESWNLAKPYTNIFAGCFSIKYDKPYIRLPKQGFRSLVHDMSSKLLRNDYECVLIVVPNAYYSDLFCEYWGHTKV